MLAGAGACAAIATFRITATYTAEVRLDPLAAVVSFLGLAVAGVLAGAIPARRGASLPAAETLRWE
jgi:ABC-type antimicrobial peptide transport system permease subunit